MESMEINAWEHLSKFQSHDYVRRWYKRRHKRELNANRTTEIVSCFDQGKEYFRSAADAATTVRPLLLYYGVLALSRGTILLLNSRMSESSMAPSHGLKVVDWRGTFKDQGINKTTDLRIRATRGTFRELAEATGNRESVAWFDAVTGAPGYYKYNFELPQFISGGVEIRLDDILSRDHRLLTLYKETLDKPGAVQIGRIYAGNKKIEVNIFPVSGEDIGNGLIAGKKIGEMKTKIFSPSLPLSTKYFSIEGDLNTLKAQLPIVKYVAGEYLHIIQDFPNGDRFSSLLRMFLLSYYLGMLVRYFPAHWRALTQNQLGGAVQPLLVASISNLQDNFPRRLLEEFA